MNAIPLIWRMLVLIAALPFFYLVMTGHPQDWIYYTSLGLILAAYVAQLVYQWRAGHHSVVKGRLVLLAVLLMAVALMAVLS